jgi:glycosyltransferase involved in cell wall biosynthesis
VIDDASTDSLSNAVVDSLSRAQAKGLRVIRRSHNTGLAAARNLAVQAAEGEYVMPLDADDLIHPSFIGIAVRALEKNSDHDFVVPQTALFTEAEAASVLTDGAAECVVFVGEAGASGLHDNR